MIKEWEQEPDKFEWIYKKYRCLISRNPETLMLCGYVALPTDHICYGRDMNYKYNQDIQVHGGITYAGQGDNMMGRAKDIFYIGFDAGHAFDLIPGFYDILQSYNSLRTIPDTYRNMNYMRKQAEGVVDQIAHLTKGRMKYEKKCRNRSLLYGKGKDSRTSSRSRKAN